MYLCSVWLVWMQHSSVEVSVCLTKRTKHVNIDGDLVSINMSCCIFHAPLHHTLHTLTHPFTVCLCTNPLLCNRMKLSLSDNTHAHAHGHTHEHTSQCLHVYVDELVRVATEFNWNNDSSFKNVAFTLKDWMCFSKWKNKLRVDFFNERRWRICTVSVKSSLLMH